jgi:type II secretion system protein N
VKKILIAAVAFLFLVWALWIVIPVALIEDIIAESMSGRRITAETKGLRKGFFYSLRAEKILVKSDSIEILSFEDAVFRIHPFRLILLQSKIAMNGKFGGGDISGNMHFAGNSAQIKLDAGNVSINRIPFFERAGIRGTGTFGGRFILTNDEGRIEFAADGVKFEPAVFSGIQVPMNLFSRVSGALATKENIIQVVSVSLEGKEIFARLKGNIQNSFMDLIMEVMPGKSYLENPLLLAGIERYRVSPGYYVVPVRGSLNF